MRNIFIIVLIAVLSTAISAATLICQTSKDERGFTEKSVIKSTDKFTLEYDLYNANFNDKKYEYKKTTTRNGIKMDDYVSGKKEIMLIRPTLFENNTLSLSTINFYKERISFDCKLKEKRKAKVNKNKNKIFTPIKRKSIVKNTYKDILDRLSPSERKYTLDNQEILHQIIQQTLDRVSRINTPRDLRVNSSNVAEFYLFANGDISEIKFITKSEYSIFNKITKETIAYAYEKFPRPDQKTLMRYKFDYYLLGY